VALLKAEKELNAGAKASEVIAGLKTLPGIKGVVIQGSESAQWPDSLVKMDAFFSIVMNSRQSDPKPTLSPMTHRTVGGKVKSQRIPMGDGFLDLMIRFIAADSLPISRGCVALVMDRKWLTDQLPAAMDSLYRENSQLLFCADSPTNHLWEQAVGIVAIKDTLWWVGRKDVKVANKQPLLPIWGVDVNSYVHTLEKK
jgi:hypothetical protein